MNCYAFTTKELWEKYHELLPEHNGKCVFIDCDATALTIIWRCM